MTWHNDSECELALLKLEDAIGGYTRLTGQKSVLILISEDPNQEVYMSQSGKPVLQGSIQPNELIMGVMEERERRWKKSLIKPLDDALNKHIEAVQDFPDSASGEPVDGIRKRISDSIEGTESA